MKRRRSLYRGNRRESYMSSKPLKPLVKTIKERCRVCYSCVRECPAKAIKISGGQAEVIIERCIGCGNCIRVCTQDAKEMRSSVQEVEFLLASDRPIAAIIAPSFPAEFPDVHYKNVVGMVRALGFDYVIEVAFGADLVSRRYQKLLSESSDNNYIATSCPAIVSYVERYHPKLVKNLAPIASPMIGAARAIHDFYGDVDIVFIGPCLAKKDEAIRPDTKGDVSEVLTFRELHELLEKRGINSGTVDRSEFDPPLSGKGAIYPIGRGLLQASDLQEDLLSTDIIAADGTKEFVHAIREFETQVHNVRLLELLCCNGCINGSGMTSKLPHLTKRGYVAAYARKRYEEMDIEKWEKEMESFDHLDLSVRFDEDDHRLPIPTRAQLKTILQRKGKFNPRDELNCGACGYDTCIEHAIAIHMGLAESEMCLPYMIEELKKTAAELSDSYEQLVSTKKALIQSEKLASLGRMASGIAHEINNPLTGVLTYSSLLKEDFDGTEFTEDIDTIVNETMRCRKIVRGLLDFARDTQVEKIKANLNTVISETIGLLKRHMNFRNIAFEKDLDVTIPDMLIDINQMRSVFNNLCENAAHAMPEGGSLFLKSVYNRSRGTVVVIVTDTGTGISKENIDKIFDPFFTTKQSGEGTGLGLAVIYGIIEQHGGTIDVESTPGEGTTFTIVLPVEG